MSIRKAARAVWRWSWPPLFVFCVVLGGALMMWRITDNRIQIDLQHELIQQLMVDVDPPFTWSLSIGGKVHTCTRAPYFNPDQPSYWCN